MPLRDREGANGCWTESQETGLIDIEPSAEGEVFVVRRPPPMSFESCLTQEPEPQNIER